MYLNQKDYIKGDRIYINPLGPPWHILDTQRFNFLLVKIDNCLKL